MRLILSLVFYFSLVWCSAQNNYCTNYTADEFFKLAEVQQTINVQNPNFELIEAAVFHAANIQRAKFNKPALSYSYELSLAAKSHSVQMKEKRFFNHKNPFDKSMRTFMDRITAYNGNFNTTGENLSKMDIMATTKKDFQYYTQKENGKYLYFKDAKSNIKLGVNTYGSYGRKVIHYLMRSPGHRANILESSFTHQGIGVTLIDNYGNTKELPKAYVTQNFGG